MATTTNYSWSTPDDTALVKDGAAAIRSLGTAIDSTVFTNAGAAIAKTIVDAKGDIIAATAADTVSRLAVGANDTVLTADSSTATGLKWAAPAAGGMTLISTTTLSGASTTISSIPTTYNNLWIIIRNFLPDTDNRQCLMRLNSDDQTRYTQQTALSTDSGILTFTSTEFVVHSQADSGVSQNLSQILIADYANTTTWKSMNVQSISVDSVTNTSFQYSTYFGFYNQTSAITSLEFLPGSGNFTSGTVLLYGVK